MNLYVRLELKCCEMLLASHLDPEFFFFFFFFYQPLIYIFKAPFENGKKARLLTKIAFFRCSYR